VLTLEAERAITRYSMTLRDLASDLARRTAQLADRLQAERQMARMQRNEADAIADAAESLRGTAVLLDDWVRGVARGS
jgi:hypothetical protein